ncbi:conserved hypothetical protein [Paraburkholderia piptadeniae]|uniref:Helix-turn-helix domain-containing protein n=1 Tax=Paraburkholderia piptadeniae TaxID=1701573 RepID=A0A1N7SSY4_9BURK|nr:helix-turn-helix domain-containing protein [Paraburkholderia piptadeniae]SIT50493.1 conserved hypothetical protein [Paraburkholderia piptadeniae]
MNALFFVMGCVDGRLVLTLEETADMLGMALQTAYNQIDAGTFPIPLRKNGRKWVADARDIAEYLDLMRKEAREAHDALKRKLAA